MEIVLRYSSVIPKDGFAEYLLLLALFLNKLPTPPQQRFGKGGLKEVRPVLNPDNDTLVFFGKKKKVVGINPSHPVTL